MKLRLTFSIVALLAILSWHGSELTGAEAGSSSAAQSPEGPLNFVFVLVDDLGYMDLGCYNPDSFYETPNIDGLASTGMRFTQGYAANPVCSPTRFSIMTGRYPSRVDSTNFFSGRRNARFKSAPLNDVMALKETTLAESFREHGYATMFAGKWHLGPTEEFWPENQGFDVNRGGFSRGGPYGGKKYFSPYGNPRLEDGPEGEHLPDRLASEVNQFISDHKEQPFVAYLAFYSVHTPLIGRPDLVEKYQKKAERLGLLGEEDFAPEEQVFPNGKERRVRIRQNHAVYAAMVEAMDGAVGKVLDHLEALELDDRTAVVLMSDNGGLSTSEGSPTSNLPLRGGKGWLYEGGIREPFIIRWPGQKNAVGICEHPVTSVDFFPTMLEMAGLPSEPDHHQDGMSLVPLLKGQADFERGDLFWHYPHYSNQGGFPGGAIRRGKWKLIERYEDGQVHLYDLEADLGERKDVSGENSELVADMRRSLHDWYREVDAKFLGALENGPQPWKPFEDSTDE